MSRPYPVRSQGGVIAAHRRDCLRLHPFEGLSGPGVECVGGLVEVVFAVNGEVGAFREVLT